MAMLPRRANGVSVFEQLHSRAHNDRASLEIDGEDFRPLSLMAPERILVFCLAAGITPRRST
jgi:hypothetical protein